MPFTAKQKQLIITIDNQVNKVLSNGGNDQEIVGSLHDIMGDIKKLMISSTHTEIDNLCEKHYGFYRFIKVLESLEEGISHGTISVPVRDPNLSNKTLSKKDEKITKELNQVMLDAFLKLKKLVDSDLSLKNNYLSIVNHFLVGIISTAVDLVEVNLPGAGPLIYANVEAVAKLGGFEGIRKLELAAGSTEYSVSDIAPDDMTTGMNYLGQQLTTALFKGLHELPLSLRTPEMLLRGIETLLANLLDQKFKRHHAHAVLDSFCEHVHLCLTDLENRAQSAITPLPFKNIKAKNKGKFNEN